MASATGRARNNLRSAYAQAEHNAQVAADHAAHLDSLLTHAPVGISLLDTELRYRHVNTHLAALHDLPPEAHLGQSIREVFPTFAPELEVIYGQVLTTGQPLLDLDLVAESPTRPGEQRIWLSSSPCASLRATFSEWGMSCWTSPRSVRLSKASTPPTCNWRQSWKPWARA